MRRKNIIAAVVLIACAILYGVLTANLPTRTLPNTPDPSCFPRINTVIILALSVWLLVQALRRPAPAPTPSPTGTGRNHRAVWALAAFVGYLAVMPGLGFILATAPFFAVMMVLFGERRPMWVGGGAVGTTVLLHALFRYGFGVILPRGLLAGIVA
jgi:putative tricarboxylic transport membrane protein